MYGWKARREVSRLAQSWAPSKSGRVNKASETRNHSPCVGQPTSSWTWKTIKLILQILNQKEVDNPTVSAAVYLITKDRLYIFLYLYTFILPILFNIATQCFYIYL